MKVTDFEKSDRLSHRPVTLSLKKLIDRRLPTLTLVIWKVTDSMVYCMETCGALNRISEPISRNEDGSIEMTPYASRMASMTLLRPSSETPNRPRGRPKR